MFILFVILCSSLFKYDAVGSISSVIYNLPAEQLVTSLDVNKTTLADPVALAVPCGILNLAHFFANKTAETKEVGKRDTPLDGPIKVSLYSYSPLSPVDGASSNDRRPFNERDASDKNFGSYDDRDNRPRDKKSWQDDTNYDRNWPDNKQGPAEDDRPSWQDEPKGPNDDKDDQSRWLDHDKGQRSNDNRRTDDHWQDDEISNDNRRPDDRSSWQDGRSNDNRRTDDNSPRDVQYDRRSNDNRGADDNWQEKSSGNRGFDEHSSWQDDKRSSGNRGVDDNWRGKSYDNSRFDDRSYSGNKGPNNIDPSYSGNRGASSNDRSNWQNDRRPGTGGSKSDRYPGQDGRLGSSSYDGRRPNVNRGLNENGSSSLQDDERNSGDRGSSSDRYGHRSDDRRKYEFHHEVSVKDEYHSKQVKTDGDKYQFNENTHGGSQDRKEPRSKGRFIHRIVIRNKTPPACCPPQCCPHCQQPFCPIPVATMTQGTNPYMLSY